MFVGLFIAFKEKVPTTLHRDKNRGLFGGSHNCSRNVAHWLFANAMTKHLLP